MVTFMQQNLCFICTQWMDLRIIRRLRNFKKYFYQSIQMVKHCFSKKSKDHIPLFFSINACIYKIIYRCFTNRCPLIIVIRQCSFYCIDLSAQYDVKIHLRKCCNPTQCYYIKCWVLNQSKAVNPSWYKICYRKQSFTSSNTVYAMFSLIWVNQTQIWVLTP